VFLIVALCVIVPIVELAVFVQVAHWIGVLEALLLLIAVSLLGVWLVKSQGVSVYRTGRADVAAGKVPGRSLVDGLLIFAAGVLLLIPGFVTAIAGLALLVPPTRIPVREYLIRRWTRNARTTIRTVRGPGGGVVTAESVIVSDRSDPQELGRQRAIEPGDEPLG
jgi:UPF0716 protein FxsA